MLRFAGLSRALRRLGSSSSSTTSPPQTTPIIVYTDGSCRFNGDRDKAVAAAAIFWGSKHPWNRCRTLKRVHTNSRAENAAVIMALKTAKEHGIRDFVIATDSHVLVRSVNEWITQWIANGFKTYNGKQVKNMDQFIEMKALIDELGAQVVHVAGHSTVEGNNRVDDMARYATKLLLEKKLEKAGQKKVE